MSRRSGVRKKSTLLPLRTAPRRFRLPAPLLLIGIALAAALVFGYYLIPFARSRAVGQAQMVVAGIKVGGMDAATARRTWEADYAQPVELDYGNSSMMLDPAAIGYHIDSERMAADLNTALATGSGFWSDFWNYLWQRQSAPQPSIPLVADYDQGKLRQYLQDVAARHPNAATPGSFDPSTLSFQPGTLGPVLDIDGALPVVDAALRRPSDRKVELPLTTVTSVASTLELLKQAIQSYFTAKGFASNGPDTFASVVLIDLMNGHEVAINPDVAYAAESTIKVPILLNMFRVLKGTPPSVDIKWLMGASILCSNDDASNSLIRFSSNKPVEHDQYVDALQQINATVATLGAKNTYIDAPIYTGDKNLIFSIAPPKTAPDRSLDTKPDPYSQTTASDMAILLQELYDCSVYQSGLIAAFPGAYSQKTCKQMIELLSGNRIGRLIELGVPPGTRVARKNGWGGYADMWHTSDAAIVYTPGGNYILAIYTAERLKPGYQQGDIISWQTIEGISRIVYNFYNPDKPVLQARQPDPTHPNTAANCVMPNPNYPDRLSLDDINSGRFDAQGAKVADACENYPVNRACFKASP